MMASWRGALLATAATGVSRPRRPYLRRYLVGGDARFQCRVDRHLEGAQRVAQARGIMRRRHEPRFARIWLAQYALIVQHPRGRVVVRIIAALPVAVITRRLCRKIQPAHRRMTDKAVRNPAGAEQRMHTRAQPRAVI